MKRICKIIGIVFIISIFYSTVCYADNPIVQTNFTADPAPMVYNGRVYLYAGIDEDNAPDNSFLMRKWKCYSSTDMVNWKDEGVILPTSAISWSTGDANAGQCIYRNGKFYFYFPTGCKTDTGVCIGVAVADSPTGPFVDIGRPIILNSQMKAATHSWQGLDPTVFIDDDGQAYLYWGNNACYWVKLNSDMISYSGSINNIPLTKEAFGPDYEEAPWLYKRNGLWYMSYSISLPEYLAYTTSTSPSGPWTYRGVIMPIISGNGGNHSGIIDYNGNSYLFYFKNGLPGGGDHRRSICVEKFNYNADGTIPQIPATSTGAPQIGTLNPYIQTEAETICWESGIETEVCSEGGIDVGNIENGDYIKVKGVDFGVGASSFDARVASATSGGNIELHLDSPTGKLVGTCAVQGTGGWQTWADASCTVSGATGIHDLYLKFTGGSGFLFNVNWWKFKGSSTALVGDLNGDNSADATDYALMKKYLLGIITDFPIENDTLASDLNNDGVIDAIDFATFKQYLLGIITKLPTK